MHFKSFVTFSLFLLTGATLSLSAQARPLKETLFSQGMPTAETVDLWNKTPGTRNYRIAAGDPTTTDLEALLKLQNADRLEIGVLRYPFPSESAAWKKLASRGAQINIIEGILPSPEGLKFLDSLGFKKILFVITGPQEPSFAAALETLHAEVALTYAGRAYPKYLDKDSWTAIPARVPLNIATDFWPGYTQMDLLNILSMPQTIRVRDMFPPDDTFPYLLNIKKLQWVTLDTDFDPWDQGAVWKKFGAMKVRWNRRGIVPSEDVLRAFAESAPSELRSLVIDTENELSSEERARLERLPIPVEWLHGTY